MEGGKLVVVGQHVAMIGLHVPSAERHNDIYASMLNVRALASPRASANAGNGMTAVTALTVAAVDNATRLKVCYLQEITAEILICMLLFHNRICRHSARLNTLRSWW